MDVKGKMRIAGRLKQLLELRPISRKGIILEDFDLAKFGQNKSRLHRADCGATLKQLRLLPRSGEAKICQN